MAVKQNNETNGQSSTASNTNNNNNNNKTHGSALNKMSQKEENNINGGGGSGDTEQQNFELVNDGVNNDELTTENVQNDVAESLLALAGGANMGNKHEDLTKILQVIELLENKPNESDDTSPELLTLYHIILKGLANVYVPYQSPIELKRFKDDIMRVGAFFAKRIKEKRIFRFFMHIICMMITDTPDNEYPSSALAIIFQLFDDQLINECVNSMLAFDIQDKSIKKTVYMLTEWMYPCNFCYNLQKWISCILLSLNKLDKYDLCDDIALENIEKLFRSMIIPLVRVKTAPVFFQMFSSIHYKPQIFLKLLPKYALVFNCLKNQSSGSDDSAEDANKCLQQLIVLTKQSMHRFSAYRTKYQELEQLLNEYGICNYVPSPTEDEEMCIDDAPEGSDIPLQPNPKVGLTNLGNTCYMNSVLQALAMTKLFIRELLLCKSNAPLLIKMKEQIALMNFSIRNEFAPSRVLESIRPPGFQIGYQQDSSEFLGYLLETLHVSEMENYKKTMEIAHSTSEEFEQMDCDSDHIITPPDPSSSPLSSPLTSKSISIDETPNGCNRLIATSSTAATTTTTGSNCNSSTANETILSVIDKTFTGKLAATYKCLTCNWKSHNVDSFRDLQLSFPEAETDCVSNYSVQDLLEYYCSPEKLVGDNQYYCEKCKKKCDAERYISIVEAPKNLILTLKHFKYDQKFKTRSKLLHKVYHDDKVSIKVCSNETFEEVASIHYELYAGVIHCGYSVDSGHYLTYAADADNRWYKFDDHLVRDSTYEKLHKLTPPNTPYILFYQIAASSKPDTNIEAITTALTHVEMPPALNLDELPIELRDYILHDRYAYLQEMKFRKKQNDIKLRKKRFDSAKRQNDGDGNNDGSGINKYKTNYYRNDDDDDNDQPPTGTISGGCGNFALDINTNRFIY